ncbi:MAG: serine--tRNA ligase [bacterium]|nr:serine--tRNA ligase [bacterium]
MFDIKWIRKNSQEFDAGLALRGLEPHAREVVALDFERRNAIAKLQEAQGKRNEAARQIGKAKGVGDDKLAQKLIDEIADQKDLIRAGEEIERRLNHEIGDILAAIPNIPFSDVPKGGGEEDNQLVRTQGEIPTFDFEPKQHFEIGEDLGKMDFDLASKMSGSRFVVLRAELARLERALAAFMLDMHTSEHGYEEINVPLLVRDDAVFGTAQLPKFAEDLFRTEDGYWLIPTGEVPLANLVREQIVEERQLPLRFTAHTSCFRSEAGSAGRDTRGMIRQHQFSKVEMISIAHPDKSNDEHEHMTKCAEEVLKRLGLHYRVMLLCTGDMGFAARRTFDLEVWLPGQDTYREISSISVCGDFQARRMNARFRADGQKDIGFVHTLNGSGLAVGRTLVAVLENYQQADGSILVPKALQPYMNGLEKIGVK